MDYYDCPEIDYIRLFKKLTTIPARIKNDDKWKKHPYTDWFEVHPLGYMKLNRKVIARAWVSKGMCELNPTINFKVRDEYIPLYKKYPCIDLMKCFTETFLGVDPSNRARKKGMYYWRKDNSPYNYRIDNFVQVNYIEYYRIVKQHVYEENGKWILVPLPELDNDIPSTMVDKAVEMKINKIYKSFESTWNKIVRKRKVPCKIIYF